MTDDPTEVKPKVTRRLFSAKYKKRILDEAAACTTRGEVGARFGVRGCTRRT